MKENYFQLYSIVNSTAGKIIKVILFVLPIVIIIARLFNQASLIIPLSVFGLVIILELFFESLSQIAPSQKISNSASSKNYIASVIFPARKKYSSAKDGYNLATDLANDNAVRFFSREIGIGKIEKFEVSLPEILAQAADLVTWIKGSYITEIDFFASYILLSETDSHFLVKNNLNNDDVINIVYWARKKFAPDTFSNKRIVFLGEGAFDSLCYGWNYELQKYAIDLTNSSLSKSFSPQITGQEKEYREIETALSKRKSANVILIGEAGVGKKNLIEYLAQESIFGNTTSQISGKKVFELMADRLISGINNAGELETRISELLIEIAYSGNCIVFIQNIENIFGGGGLNFDLSGVLDEYITGESIKFIGTTTPTAYANFIQNKTSISDLFEIIEIPELDDKKTLQLLCDKTEEVEAKYGITILYGALKQAVALSSTFYPDRFSPGRAINLLEEVASECSVNRKRNVEAQDVIAKVEGKTNILLSAPDEKEKELLFHLEDKLHERVIGQVEAVTAVADAMKRLRSGFKDGHRPISVFLFLGPTGVGKTELAKALAREYFGSEERMIVLDMSEYQTQDQLDRLLGSKAGKQYEPNTLLEQVEKQPFSEVLLDEFEKADSKLLNLFLQVFDEGRLTDNQGKTVSFENTIIIATSNAGAEFIRERIEANKNISEKELIDYLLSNNIFTPELINRFDEVVMFRPLTQDEIIKVAGILLQIALSSLKNQGIEIVGADKSVEKIAKEAYSPEFGARNIRRYIESNVEEFLSDAILNGKIQKGENKTLSVDESGNFVVL